LLWQIRELLMLNPADLTLSTIVLTDGFIEK